MAPPSPNSSKRKAVEKPISPPPLKRKTQSSISSSCVTFYIDITDCNKRSDLIFTNWTIEGAVANFFTPTSQKPKERTTWSERATDDDTLPTLLVGRYEPENMGESDRRKRRKIAAFDLV